MKIKMLFALWGCILISVSGFSQRIKYDSTKIYRVNPWVSGGFAALGVLTNTIGLSRVQGKPGISDERAAIFSRNEIRGIDRWALQQDPFKRDGPEAISDIGMNVGLSMPIWLFLDKKIRRNFLDIGLMYMETQALGANIYAWSPLGPTFVLRYRPLVYYPELPIEERNFGGLRNSFFSGHVSSTAIGTFFAAKVYMDYHPDLKGKKWIFYSLAAVPPAVVGVYRVKALKHFPTDVLVGYAIGASLGVLVPEVHRRLQGRLALGAVYTDTSKGFAMSWKF